MTLLVGINLSFWEIHAVFAVAITDILEVFKNLSKQKNGWRKLILKSKSNQSEKKAQISGEK